MIIDDGVVQCALHTLTLKVVGVDEVWDSDGPCSAP